MASTPKTYIPGILIAANYLKKYVNKNSSTLKEYMGEGLFAALTLVIDILIIVAEIIAANEPVGDQPWSDFPPQNSLSSQQINQIQGAYDKFLATIGEGS